MSDQARRLQPQTLQDKRRAQDQRALQAMSRRDLRKRALAAAAAINAQDCPEREDGPGVPAGRSAVM